MNALLGIFGLESPVHWVILAAIGVILFGKRLPEVGRSLGKSIIEFKKGLKGLEDDVESASTARQEPASLEPPRPPQRVAAPAPKSEEPPAKEESLLP